MLRGWVAHLWLLYTSSMLQQATSLTGSHVRPALFQHEQHCHVLASRLNQGNPPPIDTVINCQYNSERQPCLVPASSQPQLCHPVRCRVCGRVARSPKDVVLKHQNKVVTSLRPSFSRCGFGLCEGRQCKPYCLHGGQLI